MAYVEHGMWEVREVLKRVQRGESQRQIARATGRSRNTVRRYVRLAKEEGWDPEGSEEPSEELAGLVAKRLKPGPDGVRRGDTERRLFKHKEQIGKWLEGTAESKRGLTLTKVQVLLGRLGVDVPYGSLYRFAVKHFEFGRGKTTVRMEDVAPGEVAEVDFGRLGLISDPETGKRRTVHALVVTLAYSRHQYVHLTHTQKLGDFIEGLEDAWEFFGGVPARVVVDNLKAAVTKADRYDPTFDRTFAEYAEHRGFVIDATLVRHPTGKPHVERQVPYVRNNFFAGERFIGIEQAQLAAVRWCLTTAGNRIHGTTRRRPKEVFEAEEKERLQPLIKERFDPPEWATLLIHPDFHVRFGYAYYSVPYKHRGATKADRTVTIRADSKVVRIYKRGQLIKTHPRVKPGEKSTDRTDYPEHKSAYAMRDINSLIAIAKRRGDSMGEFVERLLSGTVPWAHIRQAQKLMRLADKYGDGPTDAACRRALSFELINVRRVQTIIEKSLDKTPDHIEPDIADTRTQTALRFLRSPDSFVHQQPSQEDTHGDPNFA